MSTNVSDLHPAYLIDDLAHSGLEPIDVQARIAGPNEKQATNTPIGVDAYVLPYRDMYDKIVPFYRVKLINSPDPAVKYKQIATSSNHVYFPRGFSKLLKDAKYVMITEGEKKAARAVKQGIPCCALGGVDSWRNRTVVLHKDAQVGATKSGKIVAKLPAGSEVTEQIDTLAVGMLELINYTKTHNIPIVICFDSDIHHKGLVKFEVQRAAAALGFELRYRGVAFQNIRQLILKPGDIGVGDKLGLDDFLVHDKLGLESFKAQLDAVLHARSAFPLHPNVRSFVNKKLQRTNLLRNEMLALSTAVISDLDTKGIRLHCPDDDNMYYFDESTFKLIRVNITNTMDFAKTPFGVRLYNDYGITTLDQRIIAVINAQFCAEQPIQKVKPEKVMAVRGDNFYYQISDGLMAKVNAKTIKVITNGTDDVLFEGDHVKPVPHQQLSEALSTLSKGGELRNFWYEALKEARITESPDDNTRRLLALLYYISPWFYRWRGTQLPIEQMLGEAGSGKSTLYALRQHVIMGKAHLRNAPRDLRDWTASIAQTGALHVTDNVHMVNGGLKQQLSDELCRVITEHDPHIESRKLYTDNDLVRVPVKAVFAVTAIKQPFTNTDIIQRSIIAQLDKGTDDVEYDADWEGTQLSKFGGRVFWVASHLLFMHRLFKAIETDWKTGYKAKYRLINVEQLLILAARQFGWDSQWIPGFMEGERDERTKKSDMVIEGLLEWADRIRAQHKGAALAGRAFTAQDMVHYFEAEEEWEGHPILTNGRKLGAYLGDHKSTISQIVGIIPTDKRVSNRLAYQVTELN